ncbi:metallophosphoesterase [Actinoplanes subglobosus]|uniref:Metallophosphoesterase n=1 Tax=Actinoplanes subglobosus TaxID=1547892 RepID=A0ABV8IYM9_9ACTN
MDGWGGFGLLLFFVVILLVIGLIHFYLWKRLVRDPLRPGWGRRAGTIVAVGLGILTPLTFIGVRAGYFEWLSWPGYLWIAVMFYLLVTLLVLEIPRLLLMRLWAGPRRTTVGTAEKVAPAPDRIADEKLASVGAPTGAATAIATPSVIGEEPPATSGDRPAKQRPADDGRTSNRPAGIGPTENVLTENGPAGNGPGGNEAAGNRPDANGPVGIGSGEDEKRGIDRRLLLARGTAIFAGLTAAGITGYGVKTATSAPQIDRFQMRMAKLPRAMDGTRIAVVSDIHIGPLTGVDHAQRIVQVINSANADLVCVVGDLVDGSVAELGRFAAPLAGIESRHGAFFVTGNHEYYSGAEEWVEEVSRLGIRPLRNERVAIGGLDLAGVNDLSGADQGDAPDFARALGDRDTARPVVLMAHQPVAAVEAAPFGVDLQVSGHTHGGQMAPFNLLVKLQQPVVSGFGEVDGVPVYVTNGAGFWGPPVRVGAPPQVTVIELRVA